MAATAALLRSQGYAATGLNEIVARSGAPRGSLYFHFPGGKEQLAIAALQASGEQLRGAIAALLSGPGGPAAGLGRLLDAMASGLEASGYRDGCPIATVALETASESEPLRAAAEGVFVSWLRELERALRDAGARPATARRRALFALSAIEGGLLLARAQRDLAPLRAVRAELRAALA